MTNGDAISHSSFVIRHFVIPLLDPDRRLCAMLIGSMSSASTDRRRVVITGLGLISPLGNTPAALWSALAAGQERRGDDVAAAGRSAAAQVRRRGPRVHRRDRRLRAAREGAQEGHQEGPQGDVPRDADGRRRRAARASPTPASPNSRWTRRSSGVVLGSDYMLTMPEDYEAGMKKCADAGEFEFTRWGNEGLGEMAPLWMLKYLPNMPASHIAIYNDLRGPNNSLTMREAAGNLAIGEAFRTIQRGHANMMVAGATGTRILPMQAIHALQTEQMAAENCDPAKASRPFDKNRTGMVAGEGAGMIVLEEYESAKARGATIYAEVARPRQRERGRCETRTANATSRSTARCSAALRDAGQDAGRRRPHQRPRPRARPTATPTKPARSAKCSAPRADKVPVTALKSYFGNLGAGSGVVELIASVLALREGRLPRVLNYETPDPACALAVVTDDNNARRPQLLEPERHAPGPGRRVVRSPPPISHSST